MSKVVDIKSGGKKPPLKSSRKGQLLAKLNGAYMKGYSDGINFLGAELGKPSGVLMKDGRIARIVYEAAPAPVDPPPADPAPPAPSTDDMQQFGTPGEEH